MSSWYMTHAPEDDIAVSTRIRLARNLENLPFPAKMTPEERRNLNLQVKSVIAESNTPFAKSLRYIDMKDVPENEIAAMVERHVISPEFAASAAERAIILSDDESISIMIGEEDHLRIQVLLGGLQLEKAYDLAERLDSFLFGALHFAFDERLGFLTECPTNLGTGLRASVMLHLPVLQSQGMIASLASSVGKIGFTLRGLYGEGSKSNAAMVQISNQITLGISEKNAIDNLQVIARQIMEKERTARREVQGISLEDQCFRAWGILQNCRLLSSGEMMNLLSTVKLGIGTGILKTDCLPLQLLIEGQPHMFTKICGVCEPEERDAARAKWIREKLTE